DELNARSPVQQHFTMGLSASRLIYTAPQPQIVDLATRADLMYITNAQGERQSMNISVIRPLQVLKQSDSYTVTSLMTDATAGQLRAAPASYPDWMLKLYLEIPPSISDNTRRLAQQIVTDAKATTPYDKAKAVESWLRSNIAYNEAIPQPPTDRDPVEWVLFDIKQGYCNYYASAMVLMLRTLGIPARMAAGFAQGTWDETQAAYSVKEKDAHTWVEVYFPGYGWIEFEPTAAQAPLNRQDDTPQPNLPTPTPAATSTPTITPTPSPSPSATTNSTTPQAQAAPQLPTFTPTPSPTATPVIVPTQQPSLTPQPPGFLSLLLGALGIALVGLVIILLLVIVGTFIYWWWEWRGMRGLSPITRAYSRLERYIGLIGVRFGGQQTPDERGQQMATRLPKAEAPISIITGMYTTERYSQRPTSDPESDVRKEMVDEAWVDTRANIIRRYLLRLLPWRRNE
nr:transglutaminase domain-containing protein [Anaerolineae bacterium]